MDGIKRLIGVMVSCCLVFVMWLPQHVEAATAEDVYEFIKVIEEQHLSGMNEHDLSQEAIDALLEFLEDPYTQFMTKQQWEHFVDLTDMQWSGIGVMFEQQSNGMEITFVFPDSPAEEAGLLPGHVIVAVDEQSIVGMEAADVQELILGEEGTEVSITFEMDGNRTTKKVERGSLQMPTVSSLILSEQIGYIELVTFGSNSATEFEQHLTELEESGIDSLIVDLRYNSGGFVQAAYDIASLFIENGPFTYVEDQKGTLQSLDIKNGTSRDLELIILTSSMTASASEMLTGALQDHLDAITIGEHTFGKGAVQQAYELSSGAYALVTIEHYLTPNKREVHIVGIEPTFEITNETFQVLKAIHLLRKQAIEIQLSEYVVHFEDAYVEADQTWIIEDGEFFVSSRLLAAICDFDIEWDDQLGAVLMNNEQQTEVFLSDETDLIKIEDGISYLHVERFAERFSAITVQSDLENQQITFNIK